MPLSPLIQSFVQICNIQSASSAVFSLRVMRRGPVSPHLLFALCGHSSPRAEEKSRAEYHPALITRRFRFSLLPFFSCCFLSAEHLTTSNWLSCYLGKFSYSHFADKESGFLLCISWPWVRSSSDGRFKVGEPVLLRLRAAWSCAAGPRKPPRSLSSWLPLLRSDHQATLPLMTKTLFPFHPTNAPRTFLIATDTLGLRSLFVTWWICTSLA